MPPRHGAYGVTHGRAARIALDANPRSKDNSQGLQPCPAFPNGCPEALVPGEPWNPQPHPSCSACSGHATPGWRPSSPRVSSSRWRRRAAQGASEKGAVYFLSPQAQSPQSNTPRCGALRRYSAEGRSVPEGGGLGKDTDRDAGMCH